MSHKMIIFGVLGAAVITALITGMSYAGHQSGRDDPQTAVVHDSSEKPSDVRRHWTPERERQAEENTRHQTSSDD